MLAPPEDVLPPDAVPPPVAGLPPEAVLPPAFGKPPFDVPLCPAPPLPVATPPLPTAPLAPVMVPPEPLATAPPAPTAPPVDAPSCPPLPVMKPAAPPVDPSDVFASLPQAASVSGKVQTQNQRSPERESGIMSGSMREGMGIDHTLCFIEAAADRPRVTRAVIAAA